MPDPRPVGQHTSKGEATRRRLLDAAATELLATRGDVELAAVARRANVSSGLPYRYFASKADLLAAVVEDFFDRFDDAVVHPKLAEVSDDWWEREQKRIGRMVEFFYKEPLSPHVVSLMAGDAIVTDAQRTRVRDQIEAASRNIRAGQRAGVVPRTVDPDLAASLVMGGLFSCVVTAMSKRPRYPKARLERTLVRLVGNVLELPVAEN